MEEEEEDGEEEEGVDRGKEGEARRMRRWRKTTKKGAKKGGEDGIDMHQDCRNVSLHTHPLCKCVFLVAPDTYIFADIRGAKTCNYSFGWEMKTHVKSLRRNKKGRKNRRVFHCA